MSWTFRGPPLKLQDRRYTETQQCWSSFIWTKVFLLNSFLFTTKTLGKKTVFLCLFVWRCLGYAFWSGSLPHSTPPSLLSLSSLPFPFILNPHAMIPPWKDVGGHEPSDKQGTDKRMGTHNNLYASICIQSIVSSYCGYNVVSCTYYILCLLMIMQSGLTSPVQMLFYQTLLHFSFQSSNDQPVQLPFHWKPSLLQPSEPCSEYIPPRRSRNWCLHNLAKLWRPLGKCSEWNDVWMSKFDDCSRKRTDAESFFHETSDCAISLWKLTPLYSWIN